MTTSPATSPAAASAARAAVPVTEPGALPSAGPAVETFRSLRDFSRTRTVTRQLFAIPGMDVTSLARSSFRAQVTRTVSGLLNGRSRAKVRRKVPDRREVPGRPSAGRVR